MVDVDFYVCVLAFAIPGVSTKFNIMSLGYSSNGLHLSIHLRQSTERQMREQRELDESNACMQFEVDVAGFEITQTTGSLW